MARIRSVHPGLFTDEAFAQLSDAAQIFWIGLWTEADDQGIFEWKPVTLKMRLRPASTSSVEPLLSELLALDCVRQFEIGAKKYGAIRNFRRFQNPKKPNRVHVLPDEFRTYVALPNASSEPEAPEGEASSEPPPDEAPPIPPRGEIFSLMEDGGGREGEKETSLRSVRVRERGSRISPDWQPRQAEIDLALELGVDIRKAAAEFRDYWLSRAKDATKLDWDLTFRNRLRELAEQGKYRISRPGSPVSRPAIASFAV